MDWSRGYSAEWRVVRVDPSTWADAEAVGAVDSASVERTADGLMESGSMTAVRGVGEGFEPGYHRIVMVAEQDGAKERVEVCTLYCTSAQGEVERGRDVVDVVGRSVLYPASVRRLLAGTYAPKGADCAAYAARLLRECVACPVEVEGAFALADHVVFDLGDSYLDAARAVLDAGGYCMQVDSHGTVHVRPLPAEPAAGLGALGASMLMPKVGYELDYSDVPNRYLARDGELQAVAVNDDPASPTSTVSRGYFHDEVDTSPKPLEGESLATYARRRLAEKSVVKDARRYEREFAPDVLPNSIVRATAAQGGLEGDLRVTRQSLELGHGVKVTEEAVREVSTWQA